jgi:hypothetical protein
MTSPVPARLPLAATVPATQQVPVRSEATRFRP